VHKTFTDEYDPTIHDTYSHPVSVLDESYQLEIHDLSGLEEYDNRALIFQADALILVYSITEKRSLMWVRDLAAWGFIGAVPCALVGTKMDLTKTRQVSAKEGRLVAKELGVNMFLEVSAKRGHGVGGLFPKLTALLERELEGEDAMVRKVLAEQRSRLAEQRSRSSVTKSHHVC
jgi:GTPase SAR1 family protein